MPYAVAAESKDSGEKPVERLSEVVVSASRIPVSLDKMGSAVTVITSREMEEKGQTRVQDVLRQSVGMDLLSFGGPGKSTSVQLRGANSNQTMILIDGVPFTSATSDAPDLTNLPTSNIERIEVVRGNMSTLYGSNAIGGVINIITKRGTKTPEVNFSSGYGSWQTIRSSLGYRGMLGKLRYALSSQYERSGGLSAADQFADPSLTFEDDMNEAKSFSAAFSYPLPKFDVDMSINYTDAVTEIDAGAFPVTAGGQGAADTNARFSWKDSLNSNVQISKVVNEHYDWKIALGYGFEKNDGKQFGTTAASAGNFHILSFVRTADFQHNYRVGAHTLTLGLGGESQNGKSVRRTVPFGRLVRESSLYGQDFFEWKDWTWTIGGRVDNIRTDSGYSYLTPLKARTFRASVSRPIGDEYRFHSSYGTGFRKPSINDIALTGSVTTNSNLKPERTKGWDAGVEYRSPDDKLRLDVTYWATFYKELIVRQISGGVSVGPNLNAGTSSSHGFEIEGNYDFSSKLSLNFNASFMQSNIKDTSFQVQPEFTRRPDKKATGTLRWALSDRFDALSTVRFVGKRWNVNTAREKLAQAVITDFIFNYKQTKHAEWSFKIMNAFDEVNYETTGFSYIPRNYWLTYTWRT